VAAWSRWAGAGKEAALHLYRRLGIARDMHGYHYRIAAMP